MLGLQVTLCRIVAGQLPGCHRELLESQIDRVTRFEFLFGEANIIDQVLQIANPVVALANLAIQRLDSAVSLLQLCCLALDNSLVAF